MFSDFPQFVPQKICLSCRGCCRFRDADSVWRPKVAAEEMKINPDAKVLKEAVDEDGYLKTVCEKSLNRCTFLDLSNNTCSIYADRPFECRLYPFLFTRKDGRLSISVHLSCPYVLQSRYSPEFEKHLGVLKDYLSGEEGRRFLKNNPGLWGDYSGCALEIEELFTLEDQTP